VTAVLEALEGLDVKAVVTESIRDWTTKSDRSQQSDQGLLGPSEIGACRAYIAHTIAGTERLPEEGIKLAAFVGEAVGELTERAVITYLAKTIGPLAQQQVPLTARLPGLGLEISGHADLVVGPRVWDAKGLACDTPIPTPTGWSTMERLDVGDEVIDMSGRPTRITRKSQVKHLDCYEVFLDRSSHSVVCDAEHIWWVIDRGGRLVEMNVLDMIGQKGLRIPVAQPVALPAADLPIDPWFLGYWLGNGNSKATTVHCHADDADEIASMARSAGLTASIRHLPERGRAAYVNVRSGPKATRNARGVFTGEGTLGKALADLGVFGKKHVPDIYLRGSVEQRLAILRGLMDSDGTWNRTRHQAEFTSVDQDLRDAVAELARSLGQKVSVSDRLATGFGKTVRAYRLAFTPTINPFSLARKAALVDQAPVKSRTRTGGHGVSQVRKIPSVPTQCIAVDSPTRSFLAGRRMVPTHNTKDGLADVRRNGADFKHVAQINTYQLARIQQGLATPEDEWSLIYIDRSGADENMVVISGPYDPEITTQIEARLEDAMYAAEHDLSSAPRDEPYPFCASFCAFFNACRGGDEHQSGGLITDQGLLDAEAQYREGKALEKEGKALAKAAADKLAGVYGSTGKHTVTWTEVPATFINGYTRKTYTRIDVRPVRTPKKK
jgi:hypothetical protein